MKTVFTLHGGKQFEELLRQLPPRTASRVANNALRAGARVIRDDAKKRVPVLTGELKKQLKVTTTKPRDPNKKRVRVGIAGTEGPLAHLVEFGSAPHPIQTKRKKVLADPKTGQVFGVKVAHPGTPPRPFLRPAADTKAGEALVKIGETLGKGIEKEAAKLAEKGRLPGRRR